jgi:hypothetical protein
LCANGRLVCASSWEACVPVSHKPLTTHTGLCASFPDCARMAILEAKDTHGYPGWLSGRPRARLLGFPHCARTMLHAHQHPAWCASRVPPAYSLLLPLAGSHPCGIKLPLRFIPRAQAGSHARGQGPTRAGRAPRARAGPHARRQGPTRAGRAPRARAGPHARRQGPTRAGRAPCAQAGSHARRQGPTRVCRAPRVRAGPQVSAYRSAFAGRGPDRRVQLRQGPSSSTGPAASCLLPLTCCLLPAASCLLPLACCLLPAASCLLPLACCLLPAAGLPGLALWWAPGLHGSAGASRMYWDRWRSVASTDPVRLCQV